MADPRSASSKLIAERLRLGATPPPSAHPDADLLTAFAERSLDESERAQVLEHLTYCAVCRDVVYLALPEEEAPPQAASPAPTPWFAWRRLQWAALAASLSVIAAVAVFVREHPERSVFNGTATTQPSPQSSAQSEAKDNATSAYTNVASSAGVNERSERRESTLQAAENQENFKSEPKHADEAGQKGFRGSADLKSRDLDTFAKLSPKVTSSSGDDLNKKARLYDKEAATKQAGTSRSDGAAYAYSIEKDAYITGSRSANGASDSNGLFDLRQQKVQSGPSANLNTQNSAQNATTNGIYLDHVQVVTKSGAPASAPTAPPSTKTDSSVPEQTASAKLGMAVGGTVDRPVAQARPAAPTRAVVPAEEARKKKLETIPAHATPQGTEETVAVTGKAAEVEAAKSPASDTASELHVKGRDNATLMTLNPGVVAPTSAITDWRVRHGRLQERLYGNWHEVILRKQPMSGDDSVTELSAAFANSNKVEMAPSGPVHSVSADTLVPPQRYTSVAHLGADVWLVEVVGKSQLVVHHSRDAGITWQPSAFVVQGILNPNAQTAIKFKDAQQGEITLSSGEKWQTTDGGAHWNLVK